MTVPEKNDPKDQWVPLRFLLGDWVGTGTGRPGASSAQRSCSLTLAGQFMEIRNRSEFLPRENNPSGEIHEEPGLISYDTIRSLYILREFHV